MSGASVRGLWEACDALYRRADAFQYARDRYAWHAIRSGRTDGYWARQALEADCEYRDTMATYQDMRATLTDPGTYL